MGRPRASTMEEFEKFQGETANQEKGIREETKQEVRKIKEEYESYITLKLHRKPEPSTQGLNLTSLYDTLTSSEVHLPGDRYDSIQGALHTLCLLVCGL